MRFVLCFVCCFLASAAQTFGQFKLDIENVADSMNTHDDSEFEESDLIQDQELKRIRIRLGNEPKWKEYAKSQLDAAVKRIAENSFLSNEELEKLRLAGEIDVARLFAEMDAKREGIDQQNRQQVLNYLRFVGSYHNKIAGMFSPESLRPKLQIAAKSEALFNRVANTLLNGQRIGPDREPIKKNDDAQPRVAKRVPPPRHHGFAPLVVNIKPQQQIQLEVEIEETMQLLDRKWMNARMKQRGTLE